MAKDTFKPLEKLTNYSNKELKEWFEQRASDASKAEARKVLFTASQRQTGSAFVGEMYLFKYDPKTKAKLPMYDKYPLTLILERKSDGFLGLNLHYLSKGQRYSMLNIFQAYASGRPLKRSVSTSFSYNWDGLMQSISGKGVESLPKACLKRYLYGHCRSRFIHIKADEYDKAIQLPVDEWVIKG